MSRFQSFIFFEKVNKGNLKIVNFNYEKRPDLANCHFNKGHVFLKARIFLIEKQKNQRNEHNFSKIVISVLKIGIGFYHYLPPKYFIKNFF